MPSACGIGFSRSAALWMRSHADLQTLSKFVRLTEFSLGCKGWRLRSHTADEKAIWRFRCAWHLVPGVASVSIQFMHLPAVTARGGIGRRQYRLGWSRMPNGLFGSAAGNSFTAKLAPARFLLTNHRRASANTTRRRIAERLRVGGFLPATACPSMADQ